MWATRRELQDHVRGCDFRYAEFSRVSDDRHKSNTAKFDSLNALLIKVAFMVFAGLCTMLGVLVMNVLHLHTV